MSDYTDDYRTAEVPDERDDLFAEYEEDRARRRIEYLHEVGSVTSDPKPQRPYRASRYEWALLHAQFLGSPCAICGRKFQSLHHIIKRRNGDDVPANLLPLCGSGTTGCHGRVEARHFEALASVRNALQREHLDYIEKRIGRGWEAWLDRAYPKAPVAA